MDKLSALTLDQALKSMKDEGARAVIVKEIDDLKRKTDMSNVKNLATDQIFTLRDSSGEIRAYKQRCVLSLKDKTLTKAGEGGDLVISAQGYEVWAEATGTSVVFPTHVMVDGKPVANPHVERDPKNRRILSVTARAVAYRFSSKGIPQVSDWTTIFDAPSYRMIDLLAKAKKYKDAFILRPVETGPPEEEGTWAAYPNDESTTLWILTSHDEALTWYSQILNREKKAMDFAQTFAKRNAVKHLCALQKAPGPTWEMSVICWRPTSGNIIKWDGSTYAQLQDNAGKLSGGAGEQFNTKQIEAQTGSEKVGDDELLDDYDPEDPIDVEHTETDPEGPAPGANIEDNLDPDIMKKYVATIAMLPEEVKVAMELLGIPMDSEIDAEKAEQIMKRVNQMMDEENQT